MTLEELYLWISIISGFAIIGWLFVEFAELRQLIKASRNTNLILSELVNNPETAGAILRNGFIGMAKDIKRNPEYAGVFFEFISAIFFTGYARLRNDLNGDMPKIFTEAIIKATDTIKSNPELNEAIFEFIAAAGTVAMAAGRDAAKEEIKNTIDKEIPLPKKYRWVAGIIDKMQAKNPPVGDRPPDTKKGLSPLKLD